MNTLHSSAFFMRQALAASRLALPHCLPNPPVGCVLFHHFDASPFSEKVRLLPGYRDLK